MIDLSILFADVVGSTQLHQQSGEVFAHKTITAVLRQLCSIAAQNKGSVIKTIGDEVLCTFPGPCYAACAAIAMQQAVAMGTDSQQRIRIGANCGPVLVDGGGDVHGDTVNVAARLVSLAQPGQILVTGGVVEGLPIILRTGSRFINSIIVRGREGLVDVYEII